MNLQYIENMIRNLESRDFRKSNGHKVTPMEFDGASIIDAVNDQYSDWHIWGDARPDLIKGPIDQSGMIIHEDKINYYRLKRVSPSALRGRTKRFSVSPFVLSAAAHEYTSDCPVGTKEYLEYKNGKWRFLNEIDEKQFGKFFDIAQCLVGVAFREQYFWKVSFAFDESPSISFETDPIGAREAFKLRDPSPGKERRSALLHWVSEHFRQNRGGDLSLVSEYLRGSQKFKWNGLTVTISPSMSDLERLENRKHN